MSVSALPPKAHSRLLASCKVSIASPCRRTIPLEIMLRLLSYLTLAFSLGATVAQAQRYPDHPVKVMVGYAAGSGPDIQARTVSAQLSLDLGQQFFVENRTGAKGLLVLVRWSRPSRTAIRFFIPQTE